MALTWKTLNVRMRQCAGVSRCMALPWAARAHQQQGVSLSCNILESLASRAELLTGLCRLVALQMFNLPL